MGGVIYIGDQAVGKTTLALELMKPGQGLVTATPFTVNYTTLKDLLLDSQGRVKPTGEILAFKKAIVDDYSFEVDMTINNVPCSYTCQWLDTPGEIWQQSWQSYNHSEWQNVLNTFKSVDGILLILAPYREIILFTPPNDDPSNYLTRKQWIKRFDRWVHFFNHQCPKIRHLIICLHKVDLVCSAQDLSVEIQKLSYNPNDPNWQWKNTYIKQRYFSVIREQLQQLDQGMSGRTVRCFISSTQYRDLLELPWIYLGSYLAT